MSSVREVRQGWTMMKVETWLYEIAFSVRFRRRTRLNLQTLIRLGVLCLIVIVILKLLKVI